MSDGKLRVGIIGVGGYAAIAHLPHLQATGRAEVAAISRRHPERLAMAKRVFGIAEAYTDWREMLAKVPLDAVVVSTPHDAHLEPTLAALERGLHVLLEKPMALTSRDAWAMVEAAGRAERVLMIGYNRRGSGRYRAAIRALEQGAIGRVRQVNLAYTGHFRHLLEPESKAMADMIRWASDSTGLPAEFFDDWVSWRRQPERSGGGPFADAGSHYVDMALWFGGARPAQVVACHDGDGGRVEWFMNVQARLTNGVLLSLTAADVDVQEGEENLFVVGDEGMLTGNPEKELWITRQETRTQVESLPDITPAAAFVATVCDGAPNICPGEEGARAVELTEAAYRSAAEGRIVRAEQPPAMVLEAT